MPARFPSTLRALTSVDRTCTEQVMYSEPDRYRWLYSLPADQPISIRGAGLSYTAASFSKSSRTVSMRHFNRILDFIPERNLITVEAGVTLEQLFQFLTPRKFYLPVQPGHPFITVGGCIAGDVYGKNQCREGLFDSHVDSLLLFHPVHGILKLSAEEHPDIFELTCGGFGLTGIILQATIRVRPLPSDTVQVSIDPVSSLTETATRLRSLQDSVDGLYSWNHVRKRSSSGFVSSAKFCDVDYGYHSAKQRIVQSPASEYWLGRVLSIGPFWTVANSVYHQAQLLAPSAKKVSLHEYMFPISQKCFYYSLFRGTGFLEQQILIPEAREDDYLAEFQQLVSHERPSIALTSCKIFRGKRRLLRFNGTGTVLTLDVKKTKSHLRFFDQLDCLNIKHGAHTNVLKDSRLSVGTVEAQYPELSIFSRRLSEFCPKRLFRSELSERLCI